jgi:hypothetical protein
MVGAEQRQDSGAVPVERENRAVDAICRHSRTI